MIRRAECQLRTELARRDSPGKVVGVEASWERIFELSPTGMDPD